MHVLENFRIFYKRLLDWAIVLYKIYFLFVGKARLVARNGSKTKELKT